MKNKLNWNIYSNEGRNNVIEEIKEKISSSDGWILNSNFFSDISLSLTIEIEEKNIETLHTRIGSSMSISKLDYHQLDKDSEKEWWVFLNINFTKGTGNLKTDIPDVPG